MCSLSERCTPEETVAINWLKRNLEAEEDLRKNWRLCSRPRLKELLVNNVFTPVKYIESWNDILKLPSVAYKLVSVILTSTALSIHYCLYLLVFSLTCHFQVVDDFEVLPEVCARYEPLRGKANALLTNWTKFAEYVSKLLDCPKNGLKKEEVNEFKALLNSASDESKSVIFSQASYYADCVEVLLLFHFLLSLSFRRQRLCYSSTASSPLQAERKS